MIAGSTPVTSDGYVVRPARGHDAAAVARELAAYLAHIGESFDGDGLDHDIADWERFEAARKALGPGLSRRKPAARYGINR